jgi:hypothetical protein
MTTLIRRRTVRAVLAVGALVTLVACGGDDDGDTAAAADSDGAYCDDLVAFNAAVMETDLMPESSPEEIEETAAVVGPRWDALRASAPSTVSDEVDSLDGSIEALREGDGEPFNSEETFVAYTVLVGKSIELCEFETASVDAGDYWFKGLPDELTAGTIAVQLTNASDKEPHEFVVFKKNDPAQSAEDILEMDEAAMEEAITFAGATFAPPGETGAGLLELESGSYFAVCFIPIGGVDDAAPHFTAGQIAEFGVS